MGSGFRSPRASRGIVIVCFAVVSAAILLVSLLHFTKDPNEFVVVGNSMEPTLSDGDNIQVSQASSLAPNDIAVFARQEQWAETSRDDENDLIIKRITALPGDTLSFEDGSLYVNEELEYKLPESYECNLEDGWSTTVPSGSIFVMGDNAPDSRDSLFASCHGNDDPFVHISDLYAFGDVTPKPGLFDFRKTDD